MADEQHPDWITAELRRAAVTERAPTHLRLRVDELSGVRMRRPTRRLMFVPAAGVLTAIVVALLLVLTGGTASGPTVAQAAALGAQPIEWSPLSYGTSGTSLTREYASFAHVRFPRGLEDGRWKLQTWRITRLAGRQILTIYYSRGDETVSYSIAAAPTLRGQRSGFTLVAVTGRIVVSWEESDHSCLLSSANTARSTLLGLARS